MDKMVSLINIDMGDISMDPFHGKLVDLALKNRSRLIELLLKDLLGRNPTPEDCEKLHFNIANSLPDEVKVIFSGTVLGHIRTSINYDGDDFKDNKMTIRETFTPINHKY